MRADHKHSADVVNLGGALDMRPDHGRRLINQTYYRQTTGIAKLREASCLSAPSAPIARGSYLQLLAVTPTGKVFLGGCYRFWVICHCNVNNPVNRLHTHSSSIFQSEHAESTSSIITGPVMPMLLFRAAIITSQYPSKSALSANIGWIRGPQVGSFR